MLGSVLRWCSLKWSKKCIVRCLVLIIFVRYGNILRLYQLKYFLLFCNVFELSPWCEWPFKYVLLCGRYSTMPGVILENLSGRKLSVLVSVLAVLLVACFLIGGIVAPAPSNASSFLMTKCEDDDQHKWYYTRGIGSCKSLDLNGTEKLHEMSKKVVFTIQIPFPKDNEILDFSRWQQNLIGVLMFEIIYDKLVEMPRNVPLTMDVRLVVLNLYCSSCCI